LPLQLAAAAVPWCGGGFLGVLQLLEGESRRGSRLLEQEWEEPGGVSLVRRATGESRSRSIGRP